MKMRKVGLIGGMSFEGSAVYYRKINEAVRRRLGDLHSAELLLHSVDFQTIVDMQKAGRWDDAGRRLSDVARGLEGAGADCVMICAVTMHLVADTVEASVDVPFIHIVDETAQRLKNAGCSRPLLLATRYTMENGFYPARMARHGIDVMVPDADGRTLTHNIIFDELCAGKVLQHSRDTLISLIEKAKENGADAVIFGCTEICLILDTEHLPLPGFDSTAIHVDAAVEFAIGKDFEPESR
ncbi:aspartate/glutamate racemase family protein [Burkholderia lata]|uniref:aspartate/glutamate racemase family protein n=1 Tax=Burkholderia lata (strain ATCC 17760 / DSM 23089 / LMG 22485 / NCIMB 9086 / R18194 / 383) TaxID=482957 RepID=UPI00145390C3|nr:aspartate/glutamate racemase family protein [Burkholderia lata]VWB87523.1 aspartate racemase [Burkholderia lata]